MTTEPPRPAPGSATVKPPRRSIFGRVTGPRMNRKVFWIWSGGLIAVAVALAFLPLPSSASAPTAYFWIVVFTARLHDIGRSGWWQALLYIVQIGLIVGLAFGAGWPVDDAAGVSGVLQLLAVIALGAIPGQRGPNRFGPAPGQPPAEAISETFS